MSVNFNRVDHSVWELQQRSLDIQYKLVEIGRISIIRNWACSKGFVQFALESQRECVAANYIGIVVSNKLDLLHLVLTSASQINSLIHNISSVLAHSL